MSSTDNFAIVLTLATAAATAAVAAVAAKENKDRTAIAAIEKAAASATAANTAAATAAATAADATAAAAAAAYAAADAAAAAAAAAADVDGDKVREFITYSSNSLERFEARPCFEARPYNLSPETRKERIAFYIVLCLRLTEVIGDQERKINDLKQQVGELTGPVLPMENNDKQNRAERFSRELPPTEQLDFLRNIVYELRDKVNDQKRKINTLTQQLKATQLPAKSAK